MTDGVGGAPSPTDFDLKGALQRMIRDGASDLHLTAGSPPAMRVHGRIESVFVFSLNDAGSIASIQVARNPDKLAHLERRLAV